MKTEIVEFRIVDNLGRPGLWCSEKRMAEKLSGDVDGLEGYAIDRRVMAKKYCGTTRWPISQLDLMALSYDEKVKPL